MLIFRANRRIGGCKNESFFSRCREKIKNRARSNESSDFFSEMGNLGKKQFLIALGFALLDIVVVAGITSIIFRITFFRDFASPWCWIWSAISSLVLWFVSSIIIYLYHEKQVAAEKRLAEKLIAK